VAVNYWQIADEQLGAANSHKVQNKSAKGRRLEGSFRCHCRHWISVNRRL